jgi:hypothetical protein
MRITRRTEDNQESTKYSKVDVKPINDRFGHGCKNDKWLISIYQRRKWLND